jgi:hypothetical protein
MISRHVLGVILPVGATPIALRKAVNSTALSPWLLRVVWINGCYDSVMVGFECLVQSDFGEGKF